MHSGEWFMLLEIDLKRLLLDVLFHGERTAKFAAGCLRPAALRPRCRRSSSC